MYINILTYVCVLVDQKGCTISVEYPELYHTLKHVYIHTYTLVYIYVCVHIYEYTHVYIDM